MPAAPKKTEDKSATEVAENKAAEDKQGFRGVEVDPTPNENYTLSGVTSGAPTPETDDDAADKARLAQADVARKATGVSER